MWYHDLITSFVNYIVHLLIGRNIGQIYFAIQSVMLAQFGGGGGGGGGSNNSISSTSSSSGSKH